MGFFILKKFDIFGTEVAKIINNYEQIPPQIYLILLEFIFLKKLIFFLILGGSSRWIH